MKKSILTFIKISLLALLMISCGTHKNDSLVFVCNKNNDLYQSLKHTNHYRRFPSVDEALNALPQNGGLLILADNYPDKKVHLPDDFLQKVNSKNLKVYLEYPDSIAGFKSGEIGKIKWERGVVRSDVFGSSLQKMRIVMIHDCHYIKTDAADPYLVLAKVAGFDTAVYGLDSTETHPLLFKLPQSDVLICATKLSQFITARYAPRDAWEPIWNFIFTQLQPKGKTPELRWTASVHPAYAKERNVTDEERRQAARRGVNWFYKSNLLATKEQVKNGEKIVIEPGGSYGTEGIRECYLSKIHYDGSQPISESRRADCTSESAMALALRGMIDNNELDKATAKNLQDYIYFNSNIRRGPRSDPRSAEFGFIDWFERENLNEGVYYSDDNARVVMGTLFTAEVLKTDRWNEMIMANILAHYRATSPVTGFKPRRLDGSPKSSLTLAHGWRYYRDNKTFYHFAPHYQSWIMAMFLWFYDKTGYEPLLQLAKTGIGNMMKAYPDEWHWTNGLQQERARMILPLAWLLRVDAMEQHRQWLNQMVNDLLSFQDECGAIREDLGDVGHGRYKPPQSNEAYGKSEAPLIQENGDPVADMLYTSNFAFFSLSEAAAVTGDPKIEKAVQKLADFMVKIQVRSDAHPELDGAWYRGFDFRRWEYWASNADAGWGVWSTETGWTQGWITTMLMMRELNTNFWDFTKQSKIADSFDKYKKLMLEGL